MKIVIIGSGSKGNATYIETPQTKILIDAGISMLQIRKRLANQGITLDTLDAVFITHEHSDHIAHLLSVLSRTKAIAYMHEQTFINANIKLKKELQNFKVNFIKADHKYQLKDMVVVPITLSHDTPNCFGYLVKEMNTISNNTYAQITDTGYIAHKYFKILSSIAVIMIESNYDVTMLQNSNRPWILINRILSDSGHMSNEDCCNHLKQIVSSYTKQVILGHISEECNDYELARKFAEEHLRDIMTFKLDVAYQYEELPIIELEGEQIA
jgi:phosphoribosyl 1,2-cyclic phosphodiesterase